MSAEPVSLKRSLSLLDLSLYGLGTILGAVFPVNTYETGFRK